jgi:glycine oxidase
MSKQCEVIVVGVGVVGLAVALDLLDRGMTVAIVGPRAGEYGGQASRAAGAMLSTFSEIEPHHTAERVTIDTAERLAAHDGYPAWLQRLSTASGLDLAATQGTWVLAPAGRAGSLNSIAAAAHAAGHSAELHPPGEIPGLDAPAESPAALWLPTEGWIDSGLLMDVLTDAVSTHPHAQWHDTTAVVVDPPQRQVRCADGTTLSGGDVVLAAGVAIPGLLPDGGRPWGIPPILAGRGVSLLLEAAAITLPYVVRTPNAAFACGVHLVPRTTGSVYLGGTNRLTTNPDPHRRASVDELAALTSEAIATLDHRVALAETITTRVGLRPYCPDHRPLIGRTAEPHLLLATATYRCGVLLAPRLACLLAQEIAEPGSLDNHPYRAQRSMPEPGIEHLLAEDAAAGAVEHLLQGGGHLAPRAAQELTAFLAVALRAILGEGEHPSVLAQRRVWDTAPVVEAVPSLFALAERTEPR